MRLRVIDWDRPAENDWLAVNQFTIKGDLYNCIISKSQVSRICQEIDQQVQPFLTRLSVQQASVPVG